MPFKHFLKSAHQFELTHQLILQMLFADPVFFYVASGIEASEGHTVILEPEGGLFDIGIYQDKEKEYCICMIELKMWSYLGKAQLSRQAAYLEARQITGFHILLGTSCFQYYKGKGYDEIHDHAFFSSKVGYIELIRGLEIFTSEHADFSRPIVQIALEYKEFLTEQFDYLDNAWKSFGGNIHHHSYSLYNQMKPFLLNGNFEIKSEHNRSGADYIMTNNDSWKWFLFEGSEFEIYQEMVNGKLMIRIWNDDADSHLKNKVKAKVLNLLAKTEFGQLNWFTGNKASRWHKIATLDFPAKTLQDVEKLSLVFMNLNSCIQNIVEEIKD